MVELKEVERAGWWGLFVGPVLDGGVAAAADAGGQVRRPGRAAGFEEHGVLPAVAEVVAVGQAGTGRGRVAARVSWSESAQPSSSSRGSA